MVDARARAVIADVDEQWRQRLTRYRGKTPLRPKTIIFPYSRCCFPMAFVRHLIDGLLTYLLKAVFCTPTFMGLYIQH